MSFAWKKVNSTRISQLVNDHLHISQKRRHASSLVVETGFPTSLIDLFFKNRQKLNKPSKNMSRHPSISPSDDVYDPAVVGSPISCSSPPPPPSPIIPRRHSSVLPPPPSCVDEVCITGSSGNGILKVFAVAVLALATERLTVGITISAMLLLFLEYVGKHYCVLSMISSVGRLLRFMKLEQQINHVSTLRFQDVEIQAFESNSCLDEIQPEMESLSKSISIKREESTRDAAEFKRKSRKASIKSKMQRIVPNKFRRSRKGQQLLKDEEQVEQCEISDNGSVISSSSPVSEDNKSPICLDTKIEDNEATESSLGRGHMLLCLIVLVGLIGGRAFALLLTLSWFFLLKYYCQEASILRI